MSTSETIPRGFPGTVVHDPNADWCACEPGGVDRCDYRMLADTVNEHLNPRDADEAEVSLCMSAVERAATYLKSLPCTCAPGYDDAPCGRCRALGQWHGERTDCQWLGSEQR